MKSLLLILMMVGVARGVNYCEQLKTGGVKIRALGVAGSAVEPRKLIILTSSGALYQLSVKAAVRPHPSNPVLIRLNLTGLSPGDQVKTMWHNFDYDLNVATPNDVQFLVLNTAHSPERSFLVAVEGSGKKPPRLFPLNGPLTDPRISPMLDYADVKVRPNLFVSQWAAAAEGGASSHAHLNDGLAFTNLSRDYHTLMGKLHLGSSLTVKYKGLDKNDFHLKVSKPDDSAQRVGFGLKHGAADLMLIIWNRAREASTVVYYERPRLSQRMEMDVALEAPVSDLIICGEDPASPPTSTTKLTDGTQASSLTPTSSGGGMSSPLVPSQDSDTKTSLTPLWIGLGVLAFLTIVAGGALYWYKARLTSLSRSRTQQRAEARYRAQAGKTIKALSKATSGKKATGAGGGRSSTAATPTNSKASGSSSSKSSSLFLTSLGSAKSTNKSSTGASSGTRTHKKPVGQKPSAAATGNKSTRT